MRRFGFLLSVPLALALTVPGLSRADFHVDCLGIVTGHGTVQVVANPDGALTFVGVMNCSGANSVSIDVLELGEVTATDGAFSPVIDPCNPGGSNPSSNNCSIPGVTTTIANAPSSSCTSNCLAPITTMATTSSAVPPGTYQVAMLVSVNVPGGPGAHPHALRFGRWEWIGMGQPVMICAPLGFPPGSTGYCT
jgi:hypothetical protein